MRALLKRDKHCRYPGCTSTHQLEAHHILAVIHGGLTVLENLLLLCSRHHKLLHDRHIRTSGDAENAVFTDAAGRTITARPHAPPG
jgi:predicted restriction endonuclease